MFIHQTQPSCSVLDAESNLTKEHLLWWLVALLITICCLKVKGGRVLYIHLYRERFLSPGHLNYMALEIPMAESPLVLWLES